ncbi:MAG: pyridoxine/pyridoxamine 5'-phosphate oxidase, partial [Blastococcus sp.]
MRRAYAVAGLHEADVAADPVAQFTRWFHDAVAARLLEPNAMVLATTGGDDVPSARTVLLKGYDERGFVFYTNRGSLKGQELAKNPRAALLFPWYALERQ